MPFSFCIYYKVHVFLWSISDKVENQIAVSKCFIWSANNSLKILINSDTDLSCPGYEELIDK